MAYFIMKILCGMGGDARDSMLVAPLIIHRGFASNSQSQLQMILSSGCMCANFDTGDEDIPLEIVEIFIK